MFTQARQMIGSAIAKAEDAFHSLHMPGGGHGSSHETEGGTSPVNTNNEISKHATIVDVNNEEQVHDRASELALMRGILKKDQRAEAIDLLPHVKDPELKVLLESRVEDTLQRIDHATQHQEDEDHQNVEEKITVAQNLGRAFKQALGKLIRPVTPIPGADSAGGDATIV